MRLHKRWVFLAIEKGRGRIVLQKRIVGADPLDTPTFFLERNLFPCHGAFLQSNLLYASVISLSQFLSACEYDIIIESVY